MKLEDAKTKEEVAQAIAAGDQEMIDSVDAFLEEAHDSFMNSNDHYGEEQDPFNYSWGDGGISDFVTDNEAFLDMVIVESQSTGFDLRRVPRELVKKNLEYTCSGDPDGERRFSNWGPFAIDFPDDRDSPSLEWRYRLKGSRSVRFSEDHFPDVGDRSGAEVAALIPEDKAEAFWEDLAKELSTWQARRDKTTDFEWYEGTKSLGENHGYGVGEDYGVGSYDEEKFTEWCRDIVSEHVNKIVNSDPKAAYELFLSSAKLTDEVKALLQKGKDVEGEDNWPTEDILDFVVKFFEVADEDDRKGIVVELDNQLIKTYDPESLVPDFMAEVEDYFLTSQWRGGFFTSALEYWKSAVSEGYFTKEDIEELAGQWLDDGRMIVTRGGGGVISDVRDTLEKYIFEKNPGPAVENFVNEVTEALKKTSVGEAGANVVRKAIDEKHFSKKNVMEMAFDWSKGQKKKLIINELEDYADAIMKGEQIPEQDPLATISKADIAKLGITSGYLAEEGPFKLIKLRPQDLAAEGRRMRHCVGDSPTYARGVADGSKEIWSLRDRNNKPHFTLEIDTGIHRYKPDPAEIDDETSDSHKWAKQRAQFVKQLKGKANRTPGFAEQRGGSVTKPEEVILWKWLLKKLHIHPDQINDFSAARMTLPKMQQQQQLQASFAGPSTQRLSARLDALADSLRGKKSARRLVAMLDDAAFLLAE
jgi:hypothetical protein